MSVRALYLTSYTQAAPVNPTPFVHSVVWLRKSSTVPPCAGGSSTAQIPAELIAHCCSSPPAAQRNPLHGGTCPALLHLWKLCALWVCRQSLSSVVWPWLCHNRLCGGSHLSPFCTTRFLQVRQHEHAWLHSKISGGSAMLNSGRSRPSWRGDAFKTRLVFSSCELSQTQNGWGPLLQRHAPTSPKTISELNLCTGFALSWQQHTSHYHKQQETIQVFAAWHHPTHHH